MGDKAKGRDDGKTKKPKKLKVGNRPHEERQRQESLVPVAPASARGSGAS